MNDLFLNPFKTYLYEETHDERIKRQHPDWVRKSDGTLIKKKNLKSTDKLWDERTQGKFLKASEVLEPILAARQAELDAIEAAKKEAKKQIEIERKQRNQKRELEIKHKDLKIKELEKKLTDKPKPKGKGWFGESRILEATGVMDRRQYDAREPNKIPHYDRGSVFRRQYQLSDGTWVTSQEVKPRPRYLYGVHDDTTWNLDAKKDKETVHEELFNNPFKTQDIDESMWRYAAGAGGALFGGGIGGAVGLGASLGNPYVGVAGAAALGPYMARDAYQHGLRRDIQNATKKHQQMQSMYGDDHSKTISAKKHLDYLNTKKGIPKLTNPSIRKPHPATSGII